MTFIPENANEIKSPLANTKYNYSALYSVFCPVESQIQLLLTILLKRPSLTQLSWKISAARKQDLKFKRGSG